MTEKKELAVAAKQDMTPMSLVAMAVADNIDADKLEKLCALQKDWEANEQRKAFARDFSAFESECPIIEPLDKGDKNHYAKLDRIHRETRGLRVKYGLSVMWSECTVSEDGESVHMAGRLIHRGGHSEPVSYDMAVPEAITRNSDGKPLTNKAQRVGSAMTYCRRYGELAVLNIVTGKDDDGNGGESQMVSAIDAEMIEAELMKASERTVASFWKKCKGKSQVCELTNEQAQKALPWLTRENRQAEGQGELG